MCGIAGIIELAPDRRPSPEALARMARVLRHRGPDEEGFYRHGQAGLAHRRLSIIDRATGQQPMGSADGRVWVVFNGEIYNYLELKAELEGRGHAFRTRSDTEVLLALYLEHGVDAFARLNGMFACAFWDVRSRTLVLARDRFGKKPLFYHLDATRLLFASEIKALLAHGGVEPRVNLAALHEYLSYSYVVGEETIVEGVRRVAPGEVVVVRDGRAACRPYWTLAFGPAEGAPDEREAVERIETLLTAAVRRRLVSEVPLGAFLSGGIDSSTVVALMAGLSSRPVRTFSIGFDEADYSELADARAVARHLGTDHREIVVRPSALDVLPDLVWHLDEPFGDSSAVPTYYVCRAAREHVTVALSGDGGDEVFAGYTRYLPLGRPRRAMRLPARAGRTAARGLAALLPFTIPGWNYLYALGRPDSGGLAVGLGIYPYIRERLYTADLRRALAGRDAFEPTDRLLASARHLDPVSRHQYLDTLQYLPADILTKVDRTSMAVSLEVRSPLLDHTLVEYAATLPVDLKLRNGVTKYVLRRLAARLLPPRVLVKPKQGFAIPKDRWFQGALRGAAHDLLLDGRASRRGYLRASVVRRLLEHHAAGRRDYSTWIWCLMVLETWFRLFVDGGAALQAGAAAADAAGPLPAGAAAGGG